jgi:Mn2+/Fe2+ NRAMP family transporter
MGYMRSILILAAAAFFYSGRQNVADAGLFDAYDLIRDIIGKRKLSTMF